MKHLKRFFVLAITSMLLVGCTTNKAYTWKVETGDNIKVSLKTNDGYDINSNNPFEISKDEKTVTYGIFVTMDTYNQYKNLIPNDSKSRVIEQDNKNGLEYIFYEYSGNTKEYNYVIKINDSNTGIILTNSTSEEEAKNIFSKLTITKE